MWKNRIVPALLALCMVLALLPATVFATETTVTNEEVPAEQQCACYETTDGGNTTHSKTSGDGAVRCTETKEVTVTVSYTYDEDVEGDQDAKESAAVEAELAKLAPWYCETCAAELGGGNGGGDEETMICKVMDCSDYNTPVGLDHTHNYACSGTKDNSSQAVCNSLNHQPDCAQRCQKGECDLTKGHDEGADGTDHNGTICTVDAHCPASDNHLKGCALYEAADVDPGDDGLTAAEAVDVTGTVYIPCTCGGFHHDENFNHVAGDPNNCGNNATDNNDHKGVGISVTVSFDYAYPTKKNTGTAESPVWVDMTAAEAAASKQEKYEAALETLLTSDAMVNKVVAENPTAVCSKCAAQLGSFCTKAIDCPATAGHRDDCLKLCTHADGCPNTIGDPSAHTVWYQVTAKDHNATSAVPVPGALYKTYDEAVAERNKLKDANDTLVAGKDTQAEKDAAKIVYSIATDHCPRAGVASSVVLGGDDAATEPTTPEVKAPEKAEEFADLDGTEWYAEELTALVEKGIFTGSLDDGKYSFNATGNVTGAELVVLLSRVAGEDLVTTGAEWNKAATAWASEAGYTEGVDITTTGALTRQDVILVLWRAAGSPDSEESLEDFPDAEGLEGEYLTAMKWAVEKKIIKGDGDTGEIKADASITRAEIVAVLSRYSEVK